MVDIRDRQKSPRPTSNRVMTAKPQAARMEMLRLRRDMGGSSGDARGRTGIKSGGVARDLNAAAGFGKGLMRFYVGHEKGPYPGIRAFRCRRGPVRP
ncbi:hypothetical protein PtoMrB4_21940 [Metapseudomonas otitidis]|uniref:Uncharacterized protein n=1 Tax=Metapseudomonas otitidis TaxID=319939 RepID=A0A679GNG7_9GAMM|nr:hypothetical protein PtoMrB4_21940 [Pseudomonas otitidis]